MGEVEKMNLLSNYLKARFSGGFRKNHLAANAAHLAVSGQKETFGNRKTRCSEWLIGDQDVVV